MENKLQKRTLTQLSKKVFNTPLFITQDSLAPIANYLSDPERTLKLMQYEKDIVVDKPLLCSDFDLEEEYHRYLLESAGVNPDTLVGTLPVSGTLVNKAGQTQACVELTSYEALKSLAVKQIELGAKHIVMQIDSGGGEYFRCLAAANAVRKVADDNNVKLTAYVERACSAAYAWASVAHEVIINPTGQAGSVGVVIQLYNDSKYLEKLGVERSFVYAGKNKIPFDSQGAFAEDFIEGLQKSVDKSYAQFTKFIATNRNLSVDAVIETNAKVFDADEALQIGFVDKIMEIEDFEHYLQSDNQSQHNRSFTMNNDTPEVTMSLEELQKQLSDMTANYNTATQELSDKTKTLADLTEAKTSLDATVAELTKQLADETEAKQKLLDEISTMKAAAITADRKARLEDVLGTENEQVASLLASTAALEATAFDAILSAMSAKVETEDKEMQEKGNNAKQDAQVPTYQERLKAVAANKSK